jgi:hypothetical protein
MNIECNGTIGIVSTRNRGYWYKRKGYYIGDKWVKPKRIRKFKKVPIKPFLSGRIELKVDAELILGGIYRDENGRTYVCYTKNIFFGKPTSMLKIVATNLGETFSPPKSIALIMQACFEK